MNMEQNVLMRISLHKACWVKPDDAKNIEFKEFKQLNRSS
jgi:hypothetical protein